MPHDVTLNLGTYTISSNLDKKFVLAVAASISLSLPEEYPDVQTAAELCEKVRAGSLWITRAGSCNFELGVDFNSLPSDDHRDRLENMVIGAFETFPAWKALGLDLRREYNRFHGLPGPNMPYPYSIQHVQQNSGLVAPDNVPCAYLSTVSCRLLFAADKNTVQKTPPRRKRIVTLKISSRKLRKFAKRKTLEGQGRVSRARRVTLKHHSPRPSKVTIYQPEIYTLMPDQQEKRLEGLTHISLNVLLGLRRKYSGCQVQGRAIFPTLMEMAPAVWNARYFQDFVSRSQLAPVIASALGNLASTTSQNLRQKVSDKRELHRKILVLIFKSTRAPKINTRTLRTSLHPPPIVDDALEIDQNDEQTGLEMSESPQTRSLSDDRTSLCEDAALPTSAVLQDGSLSREMDPGVGQGTLPDFRWHTDQQGFASSSRHLPSSRASPEALDRSDTDLRLEEEQLHDAGRYAIQQKNQQLPSNGIRFRLETTDLDDEDYLDEDFLDAEKELSKVLASDNLFPESPSSRDYDDESYLETEQQLAELLSQRQSDEVTCNGLMDEEDALGADAAERMLFRSADLTNRKIWQEPCEDEAKRHRWGDKNDYNGDHLDTSLMDASHHGLLPPTSSYLHHTSNARSFSHGLYHVR